MAVNADYRLGNIRNILFDVVYQLAKFGRQGIAHSIGNIYCFCAGSNYFFNYPA